MIPVGSLCVCVPPSYPEYVGAFVTVVNWRECRALIGGSVFFQYVVVGPMLPPTGCVGQDENLRVIRPPRLKLLPPPLARDVPVAA